MGNKVRVSTVADFLGLPFYGEDFELNGVSSLGAPKANTVIFSKVPSFQMPCDNRVLILVPMDFQEDLGDHYFSYIKVKNTRLEFANVVQEFFVSKSVPGICNTTKIGLNCSIAKTASIGSNCVIGNNVLIGEGTVINHFVVLGDNVEIGGNCYIKSGAIIGEDGFGFEFDEQKKPVRIPHLGGVKIGNNVEVGAKSVIARGTIGATLIEDNVKIDDQVFIAHNCVVGENTMIIAFAELSGSVVVGKNCWIAPNCTILNKIKIGDNSTIGIGALVIRDVPANCKLMGLEAIELRRLKKYKNATQYGS